MRLQRQHFPQRMGGGAARYRQRLKDACELSVAAVRLEDLSIGRVGSIADDALVIDKVLGQRGGDDGALLLS